MLHGAALDLCELSSQKSGFGAQRMLSGGLHWSKRAHRATTCIKQEGRAGRMLLLLELRSLLIQPWPLLKRQAPIIRPQTDTEEREKSLIFLEKSCLKRDRGCLLLWQPWPLRCCVSSVSVFNTRSLSHADLICGTSDEPNNWLSNHYLLTARSL